MFHWICPECGREIPPAMKECPVCDPAAPSITSPPPTLPELRVEPEIGPEVLLALAEEIREVQARRGLVELAEVIGIQESEPAPPALRKHSERTIPKSRRTLPCPEPPKP